MGYAVQLHSVKRPLRFFMRLAADHVTGATGLVPVVTLAKNSALFAAPAGTVTEIGVGWYALHPTTLDTDTLGVLTLHATAATADPTNEDFTVEANDPDQFVVMTAPATLDSVTLRDCIHDALLELGVLGIVDPGESGLYEVGRRWANRLLDAWNANHDSAWAQTFQTFILPAGKTPVTIGPVTSGPDPADLVVAQRPVSIESCRQIINNSFYWVNVQNAQWYRHQTNPLWTGSTQTDVYYEPDWPNGHLFFYPRQSGASQVVLELRTVLSLYDLDSVVTFPPAGLSAFVLTLAESLQGPMRMALSEDAKRRARIARTLFTANNREIPYLSTRDYGLPGGRAGRGLFNYRTGRIQS